jgi:hypothetical protein
MILSIVTVAKLIGVSGVKTLVTGVGALATSGAVVTPVEPFVDVDAAATAEAEAAFFSALVGGLVGFLIGGAVESRR